MNPPLEIGLNHPLAVVAILAVVFSAVTVMIREIVWIFKSKKHGAWKGYPELMETTTQLNNALQKIVLHVDMENQAMRDTVSVLHRLSIQSEKTHEAVEETRRMVHKLTYRSRTANGD